MTIFSRIRGFFGGNKPPTVEKSEPVHLDISSETALSASLAKLQDGQQGWIRSLPL
jgi:hypothetical protein